MSATKCGNIYAVVLPLPRVEVSPPEDPCAPEAFFREPVKSMLRKIRGKFPTFQPIEEEDVWFKARSMGLVDEE